MLIPFKLGIICLTFVNLIFSSYAADPGIEPIEEVPEFKPHMINHPFEGCPAGSRCTKETGARRKVWEDLLKVKTNRLKKLEQYRQKVGLPLPMWSLPLEPLAQDVVQWNSPCANHNTETQKIFLAEMTAPNFKSLMKQKHLIIRKSLVTTSDKSLLEFPAIRDEAPLYISKNNLVYMLDYEGEYYGLSISSKGDVVFIDPQTPPRFPENITCPPQMLEAFQKLPAPKGLYLGASCKAVWDLEAKAFRTMIQGWSCS